MVTVSVSFTVSRTSDWYLEQEPLRLSWPDRSPHMERYMDFSAYAEVQQVQTNASPLGFAILSLLNHWQINWRNITSVFFFPSL